MPSELSVHAIHHGDTRVTATTRDFALNMDNVVAGQKGSGLRPLEVLLASLAGCSANALAVLLRRTDQPVRGIAVEARGVRSDGHPAVLTDIALEFVVRGRGIDGGAVERALQAAEDYMSPVWAMLKGGPRISASYHLEEV